MPATRLCNSSRATLLSKALRYALLVCTWRLASDIPAHGQEVARHSIEIGALGQTTADEQTGPYHFVYGPSSLTQVGVNHEQIFGGPLLAYSFSLLPHLALEARTGYIFGHQPTVNLSGGTELLVHAGLTTSIPLSNRLALIGRLAPGISSFSDAALLYNGQNQRLYGRRTHFSLEASLGLRYPLGRERSLQFDIADITNVEGDIRTPCDNCAISLSLPAQIDPHLLFSFGIVQNFGKPLQSSSPGPSAGPEHRLGTNVSIAWAIQPNVHLEFNALYADNGVAVTASHSLNRVLDLDGSLLVFPGGDSPDYQDGGTQTELFGGVKVGLRREHYGIFAKARPGFSSFSHTYNTGLIYPPPNVRGYDFSGDLGAVIEIYPANKHLVLRSDLGQVLTYFHAVTVPLSTGALTQPATGRVSLLFMTGAGWRF